MQKTFNKRRGLATGTYCATRAASSALMPQLAVLLSGVTGYANMMRIMAAMSLLAVVFSSIQTRNEKTNSSETTSSDSIVHESIATDEDEEAIGLSDKPSNPTTLKDNYAQESSPKDTGCCKNEICTKISEVAMKIRGSMDVSVVKEPAFLIFTAIDCVLSLTTNNVILSLPFYAIERKFTPWVAATFLSIMYVTEVIGGFLLPPLFDVKCINYAYIFGGLQFAFAAIFVGEFIFRNSVVFSCLFLFNNVLIVVFLN